MKKPTQAQKSVFYDIMEHHLKSGMPAILLHLEDGEMVADILPTEFIEEVRELIALAHSSG